MEAFFTHGIPIFASPFNEVFIFLAFLSSAVWLIVLVTTLVRSGGWLFYKHKRARTFRRLRTKRL